MLQRMFLQALPLLILDASAKASGFGGFQYCRLGRSSVGRRNLVLFVSLTLACSVHANGAPPLFPRPIHLTRVVTDPISGTTTTIEEYLSGARVVSVRGSKTAISDYAEGRLIVIDRAEGTYSVTPFTDLAASVPAARSLGRSELAKRWNIRTAASVAKKSGDWREARAVDGSATVTVRRDSSIILSRSAAEVLLGIAYPGTPSEHDQVTLAMLSSEEVSALSTTTDRGHALAAEVRITYTVGSETIESRNEVVRVGNEEPSPELLAIPAGATKIELPRATLSREMRDVDHLPPSNQ